MAKTLTEKLCKNDWKYTLSRLFLTTPNHKRYYRHTHVIGKENIPSEGPLIYAANHQNALMDAMAIVTTQKHQTIFVARADIFRKPFIIKILHFMRILPIYRKLDGGKNQDNYDNNQETFEIVDHILRAGRVHGIMPEGRFNPYKRLAPLQKGIFRIALKAQEFFGTEGGIKIVPIGISWQDRKEFFKDVTIVYGKPIPVAEFFPLYQESPAKAYLKMQEKLSAEISKLMIDIRSETHYKTIENIRETFGYEYTKATSRNPNNPKERLEAEQNLVRKLDEFSEKNDPKIQTLEQTFPKYKEGLDKLKIRSWLLRKKKVAWYEFLKDWAILLLGFPIAVIGAILGFLPLRLMRKYEKLIKDQQFLSSTKYVVSMMVRSLQNLILIIIACFVAPNFAMLGLMLALIWFAERMMLFYVEHYKRTVGKFRYCRRLTKKCHLLSELKEQREQMIAIFS
ncbi:MAG: 1-acyl-sn-glycerol-3-phosphate acyltransferase [Bacteroidales bacterium]|nr:1-acyl-sn-glycerol-3-phosphate acyltransferase [Bacteroidales bacterium]